MKKAEILNKYRKEKEYAIKFRQAKLDNWSRNEELYNGQTEKTLLTRSNLHVPVVFEGVQNLASKMGPMPDFKFKTIPEGDENIEDIMKHVIQEDLYDSRFDLLFEQSKTEAGLYGRTIYKVIPGNQKNKVELVDTLAFLINPIARDIENCLYCGQQFIYKTIPELEDEADNMGYDQAELSLLKKMKIESDNQTVNNSDESVKNYRLSVMNLSNPSNLGSKVIELTEWYTYLDGELKVLTVANDTYLLRILDGQTLGLTRPPFVSWGTYTRGITFWCPSVADIYRDANLVVNVNLNQIIDNNTYRNFGMKFVSSSSGLKQNSIVPRPLGITVVQVPNGENIANKIMDFTPPEITQGILTIQTVKGFADSASGLNPNITAQKGKMSVTKQAMLQAEIEEKVSVMRMNMNLAFEELIQMMSDITKEKLTKPRAVKVFGYKELTVQDVTKKNFKGTELMARVIPSEQSSQNKAIKQKAKLELYQIFKDDPLIPGQLAMRRSVAKTFDIDPSEIEAWFSGEKSNDMPVIQSPQPQSPQPQSPQPQTTQRQAQAQPSEASSLLGQTQRQAQANVPLTFK